MQTTIDYQKYELMDKRTVFNHLLKAEAKLNALEQEFKTKIKAQKELVKFLKSKAKSRLDKKNSLDIAIEQIKNGEVDRFKNYEEYEKAMNSDV